MPNKPTCCGQPAKTGKKNGAFMVWCEKCGKRAEADSGDEAIRRFLNATPNNQLIVLPTKPQELTACIESRMKEITAITAPFVQSEKPALDRMIKLNVKYIVNNKQLEKCYETPEGQQSVIDAFEEVMTLGVTLPDMGCIIAYKGIADFQPSIEAYRFALTTGETAPFTSIYIEPIFSKDQFESRTDKETGDFIFNFTNQSLPRGEIVGVAVKAIDKTGHIVGRLYDAVHLLEKAKEHSPAYRAYLLDKKAYETAKSEGRAGKDPNGREYFDKIVGGGEADPYYEQDKQIFEAAEKAGELKKDSRGEYALHAGIPKKGGGTWDKKIYRSSIENPGQETKRIFIDEMQSPYDNIDKVDMYCNSAGKNFFKPVLKIRNSVAAMSELREAQQNGEDIESVVDNALNRSFQQFPDKAPEYEDADFERMDDEPEAENEGNESPEPTEQPKQEQKTTAESKNKKPETERF